MDRSVQRNGLVNLFAALVVFVAALVVAGYSNSLAGRAAAIFLGLSVLVAFVSWFQMRLEESERLEKFEVDELAQSRGESALFESKDAELFPARRGREQFERFFVPAFVILLLLLEAAGAWWLWKTLKVPTTGIPSDRALPALALFSIFSLVLFLLGRFSATVARLNKHPLLRPSASYVLLGAYICFVTALGVAGIKAEFPKADLVIARVLTVLLVLMSVEMLVALLLEMYRPRVKGKAVRPLYDSRLVGVLGQPETLFTTAAQTLDYQFGFKVSDTWLFQVLKKNLPLLLFIQFAALLLSTCVVFVDVGQQAILVRFGRPVPGRTILEPGAHLKFPWPMDQIYRFQTEQIQSFNIGFANDPALANVKSIVWTVPHDKPENFLVANHPDTNSTTTITNDESGQKAPPVSLLAVGIPVQFQISDVLKWFYKNEGASDLLQDIADRAVTRYLANADMEYVLSRGRLEAADILRDQIQTGADAQDLGVKIIFVGLQDIHPPVEVAADYEKVVSTTQTKQSRILVAQSTAIRTNSLAVAGSVTVLREAESYRQRLEVNSAAQAALFTNQIPAFEASPDFYFNRTYFEMFSRATAHVRKYIVLTTNTQDVIVFDLQDKLGDTFDNMLVAPPRR